MKNMLNIKKPGSNTVYMLVTNMERKKDYINQDNYTRYGTIIRVRRRRGIEVQQ